MPDFYGKNNLEAAYIDQILDTITDLINTAIPYVIEKHENKAKKVQSTRGDQKVCGKVLLHRIAFIDCNENS